MATEREIAAARSQDRQRLLEGQKRRNALWSAVIGGRPNSGRRRGLDLRGIDETYD
jgi:hypothetical protein